MATVLKQQPSTSTVRVKAKTQATLRELAAHDGITMSDVLEQAVEAYRRQLFLEELNDAYAALRADEDAWREELEERALWDNTLLDGLEDD